MAHHLEAATMDDDQIEAAHGCYEPPAEPADKMLSGYARGIVSALLVGAIVAFVLLVTSS